MNLLEKAKSIAKEAHFGMTDKGGNDYYLHLERVMNNLDTDVEKIVGILHDLVEDTDWTFDDLRREGFGDQVLIPLDNVTRRNNENYDEFLWRALQHPVSRKMKIEDVKDNLDLSRLKEIKKEDKRRAKKYQKALEILTTNNYEYVKTVDGHYKWIKMN